MSHYIATYDISDNRIRERVARLLTRYGSRVQWSVFEIWLDSEDLPEFRRNIGSLLSRTDEFDLFPIDDRSNRARLRWQQPIERYGPVMVLD